MRVRRPRIVRALERQTRLAPTYFTYGPRCCISHHDLQFVVTVDIDSSDVVYVGGHCAVHSRDLARPATTSSFLAARRYLCWRAFLNAGRRRVLCAGFDGGPR